MKKHLSIILLLILSIPFFYGCKKDKGNPPVLPPVESMTIDFTNFTSAKKSGEPASGLKGTENSNWEYAATVAGVWKLIINTTLAVPVKAFEEAVGTSPLYLSQKNWQWSYNVSFLGSTYKARLTGLIRASDVQWKLFITKDGTGGFTEFLWIEGTSKLDNTGGQWILYQSNTSPDAYLQIDWTRTASVVGNVKYTYIKNDSFKTSRIEYGLTTSALNAFYTVYYYNGVKFSDVNVEWNTTSRNGRVKSVDYLGDANWYCWNANKINIVCP